MIFDGKSGTKSNAMWKPPKNFSPNGDWMIGEMEDLVNPKIRGIGCKATPNECTEWNYVKKINNKWKAISTVSGINVTCIKGEKFLPRGHRASF